MKINSLFLLKLQDLRYYFNKEIFYFLPYNDEHQLYNIPLFHDIDDEIRNNLNL